MLGQSEYSGFKIKLWIICYTLCFLESDVGIEELSSFRLVVR